MAVLYSCLHASKRIIAWFIIWTVAWASLHTLTASAQYEGMSLTIAPPLFQINLQPGETWASGITVVNNNPYDVTVFAEPVLFEPSGESGSPVFVDPPSFETGTPNTETLAGWITLPQGAIVIPREQTYTLPFAVDVPEDAQPGGHYAAILIGNRPPTGSNEGTAVNVTSSIASLMFLSVAGDVVEKGRIRDFFTEKTVYEDAHAHLSLRFENQGNVHLLPQGNIVIYNMFGKERGVIPVNHRKDYGNILPGSIRRFDFSWESDAGMWDIGRYRAEATIQYGKENKQNALATTYFYIVPFRPLLGIVFGILAFLVFIAWAIRAYIRRALFLETQRVQSVVEAPNAVERATVGEKHELPAKKELVKLDVRALIRPLHMGMVDLRNIGSKEEAMFNERLRIEQARRARSRTSVWTFIREYRLFFVFLIVLFVLVLFFVLFFKDVMTQQRTFEVEEIRRTGEVELNNSTE